MKKLFGLLLIMGAVICYSSSVAMGQKSIQNTTEKSKQETSSIIVKPLSEQQKKEDMENFKKQINNKQDYARKNLPEIIKDVRERIKKDDFVRKDGEDFTFNYLIRVKDDPRVFDLYCEILTSLAERKSSNAIEAKVNALLGLREIGDTKAIPVLKKVLNDKNNRVRVEAANTLYKLGEKNTALAIFTEVASLEKVSENDVDGAQEYLILNSLRTLKKYNISEVKKIIEKISQKGATNKIREEAQKFLKGSNLNEK